MVYDYKPEAGSSLLFYHTQASILAVAATTTAAGAVAAAGVTDAPVVLGGVLQMHEGRPVAENSVKYIIRTDIMYKRKVRTYYKQFA